MAASAEFTEAAVGEADDALRALLSSILSGRYKQELYLWHVSELCRDEPESAPRLLGLVDRYYRLGRMPETQYQQLKARIELAMGTRSAAEDGRRGAEDSGPPRDDPRADPRDDIGSEDSLTCVLPAPDEPVAPAATQAESQAAPPAAPQAESPAAPAAPEAAADAPGKRIGTGSVLRGRYELLQLLGRGGMACVYQARDRYRASLGVADCLLAIKIVQPHPSRPGGINALGREFHNAQRLSHPNVVNVYDIDREGDASFYSMELLDGVQLGQLLSCAGGRLPRRYALAIIRDIGAAIAHAHTRGVVHADLKPHNVMITRDGQVRVLDFGSGIVRPGEPWISEMSPGGEYREATPAYASCEQLQGWCADPRDDIYALACLAYQLLAGSHPFDQRSSLVARGRRMRPRRPSGMRGDHWRALRRGLAFHREQRDTTMERWLEQLGVAEAAPELPPLARLAEAPAPRQWPQRVATTAMVLFSLGLAAFAIDRQSGVDWPQVLADVRHSWGSDLPQLQHAVAQPTAVPAATVSTGATHAARIPGVATSVAATSVVATPVAAVVATSVAARPVVAKPVAATPVATAGTPRVGFAAASYDVAAGEPAARIEVRRQGSSNGDVSFIWWTEGASARPDVDYAELGRRVEKIPSGMDKITLFVPIISNPQRGPTGRFYVVLDNTGAAASNVATDADATGIVAPGTRAAVTIDRGE